MTVTCSEIARLDGLAVVCLGVVGVVLAHRSASVVLSRGLEGIERRVSAGVGVVLTDDGR